MKIGIDDWHFRSAASDMLVLDLYLDNGQHALLEVFSMNNPHAAHAHIPEMVVFCELPGEKMSDNCGPGRWISRPPERNCQWSNVQAPPALMEQIRSRLGEHHLQPT